MEFVRDAGLSELRAWDSSVKKIHATDPVASRHKHDKHKVDQTDLTGEQKPSNLLPLEDCNLLFVSVSYPSWFSKQPLTRWE